MKRVSFYTTSIVIASLCFGLFPVSAQKSPDLHVCGIEPSAIDERHYTSGKSKRPQSTQSSNRLRTEDCCTNDVLDTALIYPSGTVFNSETWKANCGERFAMLFDLYHRHLKDFSPEEVFSILGMPDKIQAAEKGVQSSAKNKQITEIFGPIELPSGAKNGCIGEQQFSYDLGRQKGSKTYLELSFTNGALKSLQLKQIPGSLNVCTPWQRTNLTWEGLATDYNRKYMIVGMPAKLVTKLFPASESSKEVADSSAKVTFPIEVEFTPDGATVQRFRVHFETRAGSCRTTEWVSENLRTDERCLTKESDCLHLRFLSPFSPFDFLLDHMCRFDKKSWKEFSRNPSGARILMLTGLLRSYPVIGMTRKDVHDLIGRGEVDAYLQSTEVPTDAVYCDSEFYRLTIPMGCGNAGSERLQIAYKDDLVCGYRIISSTSYLRGQFSLSGKYEFD